MQHGDWVYAAAFSPDGKTVLTAGGNDQTARRWNAATGDPVGEPLRHNGRVTSVAYSGDGKTFITGSEDGSARRWDAATGKQLGQALLHSQEAVSSVALNHEGTKALTGSGANLARLWDVAGVAPADPPKVIGKPLTLGGQVKA